MLDTNFGHDPQIVGSDPQIFCKMDHQFLKIAGFEAF